MSGKLPLYWEIEGIPPCNCGKCGGKPDIDVENLWKYSDKILNILKEELERNLRDLPSVLNYPGVMADEEGVKNYSEGIERDRSFLLDICKYLNDELERRKLRALERDENVIKSVGNLPR